MENLTDFFPFVNTAQFDYERELRWTNGAILNAIEYYRSVCSTEIEYDGIMDELRNGALRPIQGLLFGALKAADPKMTVKQFSGIYKKEKLEGYMIAVVEGMSRYLAKPTILDNGENLDEAWPDSQAELKKKEFEQLPIGDTGSGSAIESGSVAKSFWTRACDLCRHFLGV